MNNYIINFTILIIVNILFVSCNDDFLERYPLDEISNETFWNTENDLRTYNNGLYHLARNGENLGTFSNIMVGNAERFVSFTMGNWYIDSYTDNSAPRHSRLSEYQQVRAGKHNVPASPQMYGWKESNWKLIRSINVGLENYNKADIDQEIKDRYIGEARLFRGWVYADLVSKFGDVPWLNRELNIDSEELYAPRTPREEVMEKVLEDLTFAAEKLPEDWGDGNAPGRLNRWAALLVKSRVCLFEGTWRKYHGGSNFEMWLQESANASKELIENGPYKLYSTGDPEHDYNAIHRMKDLTGISEVLYWAKYEAGVNSTNIQRYHKWYNGGATKSMVEDYLCTDGAPITISPLYQGDEEYENIFINRDPRLRQTILHPEDQAFYNYGNHDFDVYAYPRLSGMTGGDLQSETGYHIIKFYEPDAAYPPANNVATTPSIILRFAEALLNYAEVKAELGTITQSDLDMSINKLRDRVAMPHMVLGEIPVDPRYENDGVSPLIVEIRRERRIELFMEGFFRYDDLRRWKQGKKLEKPDYGIRWDENYRSRIDPNGQVILKTSTIDGIPYIDVYKGTDWENPEFDENKHYLWPIPTSALSRNPDLKQTPGWN